MNPTATGFGKSAAGFGVLGVLLAYAVTVHHGLGPMPDGPLEPWSPREFLIRQSWITPFEESPGLGVPAFSLVAALLCALVFRLTGSALARTLALASVVACALFSFYGLRPPGPAIWNFFGWRGSGVMVGFSLTLAATATAPLLAKSWLRLSPVTRAVVYLPVFVLVVGTLRDVTGTDPTLRFAISPWPVIPLFGMTIGSVAILGVLAGMACAAWSFSARGEPGASRRRRTLGVLAAILLPAIWFKLWHESFPTRGMLAMSLVGAACAGACLLGARPAALATRGRHLALGFALALAPLATGEALAGFDYSRTRDGTARELIDALDAYYQQHEEYPEELDELVAEGFIESLPQPKIGFGFLGSQQFAYQNFGISYNLEFSSPDWVQCAYNPSWSEEDYEEEEEQEEAEDLGEASKRNGESSLGEAWSCPSSPPELW
jgi:hypothetical protein